MHKSKLSALIALAFILVSLGCATKPVPESERIQVARDRVMNPTMLAPSPERTAKLIITRDAGFVGSLVGIDIFLEGNSIARLAKRESITVFVVPGRHLVGARFSSGPVPPVEREFVTDPQKPLRIRLTTDQNANIDLKPESGLL